MTVIWKKLENFGIFPRYTFLFYWSVSNMCFIVTAQFHDTDCNYLFCIDGEDIRQIIQTLERMCDCKTTSMRIKDRESSMEV